MQALSKRRRRAGSAALAALVCLGADATIAQAAPVAVCHRTGDVLVISRERAHDVGEDILVRQAADARGGSPCRYAGKAGDWRVGKGEPVYFLALQRDMLALDSGTGPDRRLLIYDVAKRKQMLAADYVNGRDHFSATPDAMTFWAVQPKTVDGASCPAAWRENADNTGVKKAHRTVETRYVFAEARTVETGATGCHATQDDVE